MTLLALAVGEPAERERVGAVEQADAVVERQALAGVELLGDVAEPARPEPSELQLPTSRLSSLTTVYTRRFVIAGRSREVGAKPTRCRHCKRGASLQRLPLSAEAERMREGGWEGGRRDDPRARIPGRPGPLTTHRRVCTPKGGPKCSLSLPARLFLSLSLSSCSPTPDPSPASSSIRPDGRCRARVVQVVDDGRRAGADDLHRRRRHRSASPAAPDGCRLQASLTGFQAASGECRTDAPVTPDARRRADRREHRGVGDADRSAGRPGRGVPSPCSTRPRSSASSSRSLADLLRDAPGTTVVRTGGLGTVTSLFVRGGESNYTKVLLDGIPLNEPGGAFNLSNVTTENLERVEFVRGANSALYGSDAMTGVIQLFTRRGTSAKPRRPADVSKAALLDGARIGRRRRRRPARLDYSADVAGLTTDNDAPNNEFRQHDAVGIGRRRARPRRDAARSSAAPSSGKTGTPGQTAFGRPDLDAFYKRHDGVWGVVLRPERRRAPPARAYGARDLAPGVDQPAARPAVHAVVRGPHGAVRVLRLRLRQPHRPAPPPRELPGRRHDRDGARGHARRDRAGRLGRRAGDAERRARGHQRAGVAQQRRRRRCSTRRCGRACSSPPASASSTTTASATRPCRAIAAAWYARTGDDAVGATRLHASAGKRHQGADDPPVVQPEPVLPRQSRSRSRSGSRAVDVGVEQRLAHGSRAAST